MTSRTPARENQGERTAMFYTVTNLAYEYQHGLRDADRRAADLHAGEFAATLRGLRLSLGRIVAGIR